jgi:hypothetical protein
MELRLVLDHPGSSSKKPEKKCTMSDGGVCLKGLVADTSALHGA